MIRITITVEAETAVDAMEAACFWTADADVPRAGEHGESASSAMPSAMLRWECEEVEK